MGMIYRESWHSQAGVSCSQPTVCPPGSIAACQGNAASVPAGTHHAAIIFFCSAWKSQGLSLGPECGVKANFSRGALCGSALGAGVGDPGPCPSKMFMHFLVHLASSTGGADQKVGLKLLLHYGRTHKGTGLREKKVESRDFCCAWSWKRAVLQFLSSLRIPSSAGAMAR